MPYLPSDFGLVPRETTAALRERSPERLKNAFRRIVEIAATQDIRDERDEMVGFVPFIDCARRLGQDPAELLGPIAKTGPDWFWGLFQMFVSRKDVTLDAFGWVIVHTPEGPEYQSTGPSLAEVSKMLDLARESEANRKRLN
jgi:hypothetical protein